MFLKTTFIIHKVNPLTIDPVSINYCPCISRSKKQNEAIFPDDYKQPVKITDVKSFHNDITDLYQRNPDQYSVEYNQLVKDKGEI